MILSSPSSTAIKATTKRKTHQRSPSASEIARNSSHFETWSAHQGCEQVCFTDLPRELKADVDEVFNVTGRMPTAWTKNDSEEYRFLSQFAPAEFLTFIHDAYDQCPSLFCEKWKSSDLLELYSELNIVFKAWCRLQKMRKSKENWSEADFVANVYDVFRSPAVQAGTHRARCTISLPQPIIHTKMGAQAVRILNAKTVNPDSAIMIPANNIRSLSDSAKSIFKVLKKHAAVIKTGNPSKGSSFPFQSTPCAQLPNNPGFEFVSSLWEDKKSAHQLMDAYRQNRMATTSVVRHMHSLQITAPVFGLVWASGTVRAHVDWCKCEEASNPTIFSAPYPSSTEDNSVDETDDIFHEWQLDQPCDILQVYFLIRNIDRWTTGRFQTLVIDGVTNLLDAVVNKEQKYQPWKRVGDLVLVDVRKENINISLTSESMSTPPKPKSRKYRRRRSS